MQNKQNHTSKYLKWQIGAAMISLATSAAVFTHVPPKHATTDKSDVHKIFERESEVTHMNASYAMRARSATSTGPGV